MPEREIELKVDEEVVIDGIRLRIVSIQQDEVEFEIIEDDADEIQLSVGASTRPIDEQDWRPAPK